jgi:hypothetical protein
MNQKERDIQRKLRILKHVEDNCNTARTCSYFGVARVSFCRWKSHYKKDGEAGNDSGCFPTPTNRGSFSRPIGSPFECL